MKTQIKTLVATIVALFVSVQMFAQGTLIRITPYIGPYDRTQAFLNNTINGVTGTDSPAKPIPVVNNTTLLSSIVCTPIFNSWLGSETAAMGEFIAQRGNRIFFSYDITSTTPFYGRDIAYTISSSYFGFTNTFGGLGLNYGLQAIGQDGAGNTYTSGPMDQLITRLQGTGLSHCLNMSGGQSGIDATLATWSPFDLTATYNINGVTSGSTVHIGVPEPSTLSLVFVAGGLILRKMKK